jgi:hypothetical protein
LAGKLLQINAETVQAVLDTNTNSLPVIYLIQLGTVCELRKKLSIPKEFEGTSVVFKFGMCKDFRLRLAQLKNGFKNLGIKIGLELHTYIDPVFLSRAETTVRNFFISADWLLQHKTFREIAIVPPKGVAMHVFQRFRFLGEEFAGKVKGIQDKLARKEKEVRDMEQSFASSTKALEERHALILEMERREHAMVVERSEEKLSREMGVRDLEIAHLKALLLEKDERIHFLREQLAFAQRLVQPPCS